MKEQSNRRSSSGSVPGAVFFPNHMNSYPVLSDSYIERLLGTPTIRSRASRARGYVLFAQGQKALGVYVVWEGRVKISIGSDQGKSMILALVTRGRSRAAGDNPGFAVCRDGRGGGTSEGEFRLARRSLEAFARDRRCGLHGRGKPQRDLLLDAGGVQDDPPVSVGGAEDGPLPSGTSPTPGGSSGGAQVALEASQEEIGQMIGVCRETVARVIARLKRKRILELGASAIVHP